MRLVDPPPIKITSDHTTKETGLRGGKMRKLTHAEHVADIKKVNPDVEILEEIKRADKKVLCRCKVCSHEWGAQPNNLKMGKGCPACAKIKIGNANRLTHAEQVADIAKINPNVEILGEIINNKTKVLTRCKICGYEWNVTPNSLKQGNGCPECAGNRKLTHTEHVAAINKVNPCIEVLEEIINNKTKVLCRCKICGHKWWARTYNLKQGCGCPACKIAKMANAHKLTHTEHVAAIAEINPNIEILGKITHSRTKVLCRCLVCGREWRATPYNLKQGNGCPRCAKYGFHSHDIGKLYIMVDDLEAPTMIKIGVSVQEDRRSRMVLQSARRAGVTIPALHVAKTWEGPTDLMQRIEGIMHENYEEWNIKFPAKFSGCTEFFQYTPETAEVFDIIEETLHEIINDNKAA